ncbi:hypothetical protein [Demequina sp.]|uniref:hypothetical protein n=1 Tax=Demequina sp. TaxID=2050685 RepID=UPI003D0E3178
MSDLLSDEEVIRRVRAIRSDLAAAIPRARTRRRRKIAIAAAIGAAVALTGAALVVHATSEQVHYEVTCYEHASLDSHYTQAGSAPWVDDNGVSGRAEVDPVATCGDMWRMGVIGQAARPEDPNNANFDVPALVGCTLPNGASAGFPREGSTATDHDFCNKLGLAPWPPPT